MYRYVEGAGTAALFAYITDIDFLSSTELICTDRNNHCLRHVDLSLSPPQTSTFAGSCTVEGDADGHRLNTALFGRPAQTEVKNDYPALFLLDYVRTLHMIDMRTDNVAKVVTFNVHYFYMKIFGDSLLYITQLHQITVFNINTSEDYVVAGKLTHGNAIGLFMNTEFNRPFSIFPWTREMDLLWLVADQLNNRLV